jgi:uncharacterized protein (DUF983 family)
MLRECPQCGLGYFREAGYYLGAMFINYGLTALIVLTVYLLLLRAPDLLHVSPGIKIALWLAFAVVLSLALMRHSYSFWLSLDYWLEPWEAPLPRTGQTGDSHARGKHLP